MQIIQEFLQSFFGFTSTIFTKLGLWDNVCLLLPVECFENFAGKPVTKKVNLSQRKSQTNTTTSFLQKHQLIFTDVFQVFLGPLRQKYATQRCQYACKMFPDIFCNIDVWLVLVLLLVLVVVVVVFFSPSRCSPSKSLLLMHVGPANQFFYLLKSSSSPPCQLFVTLLLVQLTLVDSKVFLLRFPSKNLLKLAWLGRHGWYAAQVSSTFGVALHQEWFVTSKLRVFFQLESTS